MPGQIQDFDRMFLSERWIRHTILFPLGPAAAGYYRIFPLISGYTQCYTNSSTHKTAIISVRTNQNEINIGYFWCSHPYQIEKRVSVEIMGKLVLRVLYDQRAFLSDSMFVLFMKGSHSSNLRNNLNTYKEKED